MAKIAIIDMGTNTFHLLLAETEAQGFRIVHREHQAVKIGVAGINEGRILASACDRALEAMKHFRKTIDGHQITSAVYAFGTSAFRNAENAKALAGQIAEQCGIEVRVLSGDEEADYIFEGIRAALEIGNDTSLVMDIGAGSVEFIIGDSHSMQWKKSFEIGGQRLLEKFHKHDPIRTDEIQALDRYFEDALQPLLKALEDFKPKVLIGSSGTFDTLSDIFCHQRKISRSPDAAEIPLTVDGFWEIYGNLIGKNRNERMQIQGMIALRVDLIVVGCCLIRFLLQKHRFERIRVSTYSLKEGALAILSRSQMTYL